MATYRQIHVKIWASPDFQNVSALSKFVFIYLFSNTHRNEAAIYKITPKTISNETDIPIDDVINCLEELNNAGLIKNDQVEHIVWVINAVRYQTIGPNMIKAILKDIEAIQHSFSEEFLSYYEDILTPSERVSKGIRNPSETLPDKYKDNVNINSNPNINNNLSISHQKSYKSNSNNKKSASDYTPEFEEFWSIYPRKKEKQSAYRCWKTRLEEGHQPRELIEAAKLYSHECHRQGTQEQFIKQAKTFIGCNKPFLDYKDKGTNEIKPYRGESTGRVIPYRG